MSDRLRALANRGRTLPEVAQIVADQVRDPRKRPWLMANTSWAAVCNICGWHGHRFCDAYHSERANCPSCDSVARDRFLYHCFTSRTSPAETRRLLETSPRLGARYRDVMSRRFDYLSSDFDQGAHSADIVVDLQDIDLPSSSLDVVLTAHVLEHVPVYRRALAELFRVLRPGGKLYLNVPILTTVTTVPTEPEYHNDDTLVHWRFGYDLAEDVRAAGFQTATLVPEELRLRTEARDLEWAKANASDIHDAPDMIAGGDPTTFTDVAGIRLSQRLGFIPAYMFVVFEGTKPGGESPR